MTFEEDIKNAYDLAYFFWNLEENIEENYKNKNITRSQRNLLVREIRESRTQTMRENDPLTKNNPLLREMADGLLKFRNID